jgi:hypothetical protein
MSVKEFLDENLATSNQHLQQIKPFLNVTPLLNLSLRKIVLKSTSYLLKSVLFGFSMKIFHYVSGINN